MKNKTVLLCISGGIAAYKSAYLASSLKKEGYNVHVLMTQNATQFITPLTFEALTGNRAITDTFNRSFAFEVEHISLAKSADLVLVAPATANVIAKLANGLADDMLTTTVLACKCKKIIAPAMNTAMFENQITQDNLKKLEQYGFEIILPTVGHLACGDVSIGKMQEPEVLLDYVKQELAYEKDMKGLNVLVTAGPTQEAIDPVRFITNHSTGKMGFEMALNASLRGANVTLITGKTSIKHPLFVNILKVTSAQEMFDTVISKSTSQDIIIKTAAVADYRPTTVSTEKIKKLNGENLTTIQLSRTIDILKYLGENRRENQFLCGFSMETQNMIENSKSKLLKKNIDMIVANNLKVDGAGFGTDTNVVTIITEKNILELPLLSKQDTAHKIFDEILQLIRK